MSRSGSSVDGGDRGEGEGEEDEEDLYAGPGAGSDGDEAGPSARAGARSAGGGRGSGDDDDDGDDGASAHIAKALDALAAARQQLAAAESAVRAYGRTAAFNAQVRAAAWAWGACKGATLTAAARPCHWPQG